MPYSSAIALWLVGTLGLPATLSSTHEGIHERIAKVTELIKKQPGNANLHLVRADLYRSHQDWPEAQADLKVSRSINASKPSLLFAEAHLALDIGCALQAVHKLNAYHKEIRDDPNSWSLLSRAWDKLQRFDKAAEAMSIAIPLFETVEPDHFHFRARALQKMGRGGLEKALHCVEDGLTQLGACISLELLAVDLENRLGSSADAQRRLDRLSEGAKRQESWLMRKGDVFWDHGKRIEAREQYRLGLDAIEQLKPRTRSTRAVREMQRHAQKRLGNL
jgi:tetratricopeptide (TPR) repeat protein